MFVGYLILLLPHFCWSSMRVRGVFKKLLEVNGALDARNVSND